jgi:hypothetical protein
VPFRDEDASKPGEPPAMRAGRLVAGAPAEGKPRIVAETVAPNTKPKK